MLDAQIGSLWETILDLKSDKAAIAFSGGGDSTALLHMLRDHPCVSHAFIIDHNLRTESAKETEMAAESARELGYQVIRHKWRHTENKSAPKTGIQVKARDYRYAAMGAMCREQGVTHLLTGHTEDDQAETLLMRKDRQTGWRGLAGMKSKAYGPLWPSLADVTLVRPLLGFSRAALRGYNREHDLTWIEDPSNNSLDFTRIRKRKILEKDAVLKANLLVTQNEMYSRLRAERQVFKQWMDDFGHLNAQGFFTLSKVPSSELLLHLLRMASGTGGPIDSARRAALCKAMKQDDFNAATLAGAWVVKQAEGFLITRDKVAVSGRGHKSGVVSQSVIVPINFPMIWDGRFRVDTPDSDVTVQPAYGVLQKLRDIPETQAIFDLPKEIRGTLPVFSKAGRIMGFGAGKWGEVHSTALSERRMNNLWLNSG